MEVTLREHDPTNQSTVSHISTNHNVVQVGDWIYPGTALGTNGNSGTTLVPHLHIVYGYTDAQGRYWSLPIDWKDMQVSSQFTPLQIWQEICNKTLLFF